MYDTPLTSVEFVPLEQIGAGEATDEVDVAAEVLASPLDGDAGVYVAGTGALASLLVRDAGVYSAGDEASSLVRVFIEVAVAELLTLGTGPSTRAATFV